MQYVPCVGDAMTTVLTSTSWVSPQQPLSPRLPGRLLLLEMRNGRQRLFFFELGDSLESKRHDLVGRQLFVEPSKLLVLLRTCLHEQRQ